MVKEQLKLKSVLVIALSAFVLASCTKAIPYEEAPVDKKDKVISKSLLDTDSNSSGTYLYSASMMNASRSSSDALPYSSGDNKRVRLEYTEKTLRIVEVERDARYSPNTTNNKMLLEIPVEHVQFQCAKDKYGECTNKEEEAGNITWSQRGSIRVKLEEVKSGELDLLPIMDSQTTGADCYELVSSRLTNSEITSTSVNFDVERTYKTKLECVGDIDKLTDATVSAVFHYSLVKLDSILSKDFVPVSYPEGSEDEKNFGFFSSRNVKLDVDNNKTDKSTIQLMNHWNPNRSELVYYLSDEFAKPENKQIKDLTYETVENINKGLKISGVKFRINLKEPAGKISGDIRNSMIVLVEDPVASNVIGYGPQTEDPVTGEIISARTVMFLGTIKKFIGNTYNEILDAKKEAQLASSKKVAMSQALALAPQIQARVNFMKQMGGHSEAPATVATTSKKQTKTTKKSSLILQPPVSAVVAGSKLETARKLIKNYTSTVNPEVVGNDLKSRLKYQNEAKNCAFSPSLETFSGGISEKLMKEIDDDALPWDQLSDKQKEKMIAIILPEIWVPTLIHEMGHNLGLRHNFQASEDKANFFTDEQLQANGVDHKIPFSSVMDYGNDLRTLPMLGNYDIAALRFGYLRTVEVLSGDQTVTTNIATTLEDMKKSSAPKFKEYGYCTDEHVGINAGCKRFDLGTTYTEITENIIKDYESAYKKRNFRNGRASMSLADDLAYASRIKSTFQDLRVMMEVYERIANLVGYDAKEWESVEWLKDLKQAALSSGTFLTNVILVPDATCALAEESKPNVIMAVQALSSISSDAMSCFDLGALTTGGPTPKKLIVVGQAGKMFNSKKDPASTNAYMDQIDIRGIWADKVIASSMLLKRQIGIYTMDKYLDNFLNIKELRGPILGTLASVITNTVVAPVEFTLADGSKAQFEINYDLFDSQVIDKPLYASTAKPLWLNQGSTTQLQQVIAEQMATYMNDSSGQHEDDRSIADLVVVSKYNRNSVVTIEKDATSIVIGNTKFVASSSNAVAQAAIQNYQISSILGQVEPKKLTEILTAKTKNETMPVTATELEKLVWSLDVETLTAYASGIIQKPDFYNRLLSILPQQ